MAGGGSRVRWRFKAQHRNLIKQPLPDLTEAILYPGHRKRKTFKIKRLQQIDCLLLTFYLLLMCLSTDPKSDRHLAQKKTPYALTITLKP